MAVRTLLPSASRTTAQTFTINVARAKAIRVYLDLTNLNAVTPGLTVTIDAWDSVSNKFVNLLTGAAITTVSTNMYTVGIGVTAVANGAANAYLGDFVRVAVAVADADAATYSLTAHLIR